jgi:hypothetical protein
MWRSWGRLEQQRVLRLQNLPPGQHPLNSPLKMIRCHAEASERVGSRILSCVEGSGKLTDWVGSDKALYIKAPSTPLLTNRPLLLENYSAE